MLLVALDTETTGIDTNTAEIVQLGMVSMCAETYDLNILMNSKCFPESGQIPKEASDVHGIKIEDLVYCPHDKDLVQTMNSMLSDIEEVMLVSYNGNAYDLPILNRYGGEVDYLHIDVYQLVQRELWRHGLKLNEVHKGYVGEPLDGAHDAIIDVLGTLTILKKYMKDNNKCAHDICADLSTPVVLEDVFFGKHKGEKFSQVPTGYLRWIEKDWDYINPDMRLTLDTYL